MTDERKATLAVRIDSKLLADFKKRTEGSTLTSATEDAIGNYLHPQTSESSTVVIGGRQYEVRDGKLWKVDLASTFRGQKTLVEVRDAEKEFGPINHVKTLGELSQLRPNDLKIDEALQLTKLSKAKAEADFWWTRARRLKARSQPAFIDPNQCPKCMASFKEMTRYQRGVHVDFCRGGRGHTQESIQRFIDAGPVELIEDRSNRS